MPFMRFFKVKSVYAGRKRKSGETGRGKCVFCGRVSLALKELRSSRGVLHGRYCQLCKEDHDWFESLVRTDFSGRGLVPDPNTYHVVPTARDPFDKVNAIIEDLKTQIMNVPPAAARIEAVKKGVGRVANPVSCDSLEEACAAVSCTISDEIARHSHKQRDFVHTVYLFGGGRGICYEQTEKVSRITENIQWLCFFD